jgi:hypothetical protein
MRLTRAVTRCAGMPSVDDTSVCVLATACVELITSISSSRGTHSTAWVSI